MIVLTGNSRSIEAYSLTKRLNRVLHRSARISVITVGRRRMQELNRAYRGVDCPTNVLSMGWGSGRWVMGDVFLCPAIIAQEVPKEEIPQHTLHLIVHGVLHILGYHHEQSTRVARKMERLERKILGWDPYTVQIRNQKNK